MVLDGIGAGLAGLASPATVALGGIGTGLAGAFLGELAGLVTDCGLGPNFLGGAGTGSFRVGFGARVGLGTGCLSGGPETFAAGLTVAGFFFGTDLAAGAAGFFGEFWLLLIFV